MYILSLETATDICSASVSYEGEEISTMEEKGWGIHSKRLMPIIDEAIANAGIDFSKINAVAVDKGPGSYTGLRIGVAAAKGFCFAADIPLIGINSLQILSNAALNFIDDPDALYCPMIDARRLEVFFAVYDNSLTEQIPTDTFIFGEDDAKKILNGRTVYFFGNGMEKGREFLAHPDARFIPNIELSSRNMALPAMEALKKNKVENIHTFEPFYLKDFIAKKSEKLEKILKSKKRN